MTSKRNRALPYGTSTARVRKRTLRFGVISISCAGLALWIIFSGSYLETTKFRHFLVPVIVILFAAGGVCGIIGLRRGAPSLVLSLISLVIISLISLICLTTRFSS